jgi:thioredoxin 1
MIAPVLEELAGESAGRYVVAKLNVDENPMTAQRYQISSIPTMLLFNKGQLVDRIVGLQQKNALAARLAAYL